MNCLPKAKEFRIKLAHRWKNSSTMKIINTTLAIQLLSLVAFIGTPSHAITETGLAVTDTNNYWQHNSNISEGDATYIICDGYVGSALIPNKSDVVQSFINNCEITPPPNSIKIIDTPENHSTHYPGYPAYSITIPQSGNTYFVCDGFLSSTSWCSLKAQQKAHKLLRSGEPRHWEQKSQPITQQIASSTTNQPIIEDFSASLSQPLFNLDSPLGPPPVLSPEFVPPSLEGYTQPETQYKPKGKLPTKLQRAIYHKVYKSVTTVMNRYN